MAAKTCTIVLYQVRGARYNLAGIMYRGRYIYHTPHTGADGELVAMAMRYAYSQGFNTIKIKTEV